METCYPEVTFEAEMMSQRFTLFYAGYTVYAPALYFSELELIDECKAVKDDSLQRSVSSLCEMVKEIEFESATHLNTAISVAKSLDISLLDKPTNYESYFTWLSHYIDNLENEFPMGRIDHYYFLYARKISEIVYHLGLLKTYCHLITFENTAFNFSHKVEKSLKDIEFILFKLMAAAALLSSEPRQNYFNVYYKTLCDCFKPLNAVDVINLNEKALKNFEAEISRFEEVVMNGFKKCISLLKELGI